MFLLILGRKIRLRAYIHQLVSFLKDLGERYHQSSLKFERNALSYLPMLLMNWASDHLTFRFTLYSLCCYKDFTFINNLLREQPSFEN